MRINKHTHTPRDFYGFKMITRVRYRDENILRKELDKERNMYRIPENPGVVIDVGAHIGGTAILAASMGAKVYAYEPEAYNFETLWKNIELNKLADKIECFRTGVGKPGRYDIYIHTKNSGATTMFPGLVTGKVKQNMPEELKQTMVVISIRDVFKYNKIDHCDLLKMDCEGAEKDIIEDLDDELVSRINRISLEFHDKSIKNNLYKKLCQWYTPEEITRHEYSFYK